MITLLTPSAAKQVLRRISTPIVSVVVIVFFAIAGVEPMGLLWSMKAAPGQKKGLRLLKQDVSKPFVVDVLLLRGHVEVKGKKDLVSAGTVLLAKTTVYRSYLGRGVTAFKVTAGAVRGMLFVPPGRCISGMFYCV